MLSKEIEEFLSNNSPLMACNSLVSFFLFDQGSELEVLLDLTAARTTDRYQD